MDTKKVLLSGVTPTSDLTLGNYIGAIKQWVKLQHEYDCYFMVADLHALTVKQVPALLRAQIHKTYATYLACGIEHACVFVQSHVPQHTQLSWILTCASSMGELSRMTQYKSKSDRSGELAGLFSYPVLMAADILLYDTDLVPVGEDQMQHLQLARDLALRMGMKLPEAYMPKVGARVMDLQDPTKKMSKSAPAGAIYLTDSDKEIERKIKRATTDLEDNVCEASSSGIANLITIYAALTDISLKLARDEFEGQSYGKLKYSVAQCVIETVRPIREKIESLNKDTELSRSFLKRDADRASVVAQKTLDKVYEKVGL